MTDYVMDHRIDELQRSVEERLDLVEKKVYSLEDNFDKLEKKVDDLITILRVISLEISRGLDP